MFANAVLSSGDILIANVNSITAGIYTLSLGELSREGSDKIGIDFNGFDASMLIGEPAYTLILADSLAGFDESDANSDFIAKNLLGALADFAWDGNMLTISFTQVPEPSAIAAIFDASSRALGNRGDFWSVCILICRAQAQIIFAHCALTFIPLKPV